MLFFFILNNIYQVINLKKILFIISLVLLTSTFIITEVVSEELNDNEIIIFIDPGHGGSDGGAIGIDGTYEKDIVLSVSLKLRELFINSGFRVLMTRDTDCDLAPSGSHNKKRDDIHKRVQMVNSSKADFYLSIHANSFPNKRVWGAQTFYKRNESLSRDLAVCIQDSIVEKVQNTTRVAKIITDVYLVDNIKLPGALVEVGFLSNDDELHLLKNPTYQQEMALAIYIGTCEYLEKNY